LDAVLKLADWARVLVQHWKEWTHAFWVWAFGWLGIHVPPEWSPVLSFLLFSLLLTIAQAARFSEWNRPQVSEYEQGRAFQLISWRTLWCFVSIVLVCGLSFLVVNYVLATIVLLIAPQVVIILFATHRMYASLSIFLLWLFFGIIAMNPLVSLDSGPETGFSAIAMSLVLPLILLSVAPAKAISRRLVFLALGLLLLIALNELSKLGLDVTAPKLQG
jgi:hypothetical protein